MKKKSLIILASVTLNLVLFSTLAHFNKVNSHADGIPAPMFLVQHLNITSYAQNDSHEIALAGMVK